MRAITEVLADRAERYSSRSGRVDWMRPFQQIELGRENDRSDPNVDTPRARGVGPEQTSFQPAVLMVPRLGSRPPNCTDWSGALSVDGTN